MKDLECENQWLKRQVAGLACFRACPLCGDEPIGRSDTVGRTRQIKNIQWVFQSK